ncbi:MAG: hypothetical protein NZ516_06215 [Raineya sp.]|nr:hypothetical protein [Raineya sp.]
MELRIIFIGGTLRGYELYNYLLLRGIKPLYSFFLKEDEHEEYKYSLMLSQKASDFNIPFSVKKKLTEEDYKIINGYEEIDFVIVCGWRTIIDISQVKSVKVGFLAAHDSLLPKYRGFAPLNWAIINGETETGVTIFKINEGEVDSGSIAIQKKVSILPQDYAFDVYQKIIQATIEGYAEVITKYKNNDLQFFPQKESDATYTCKRTPNDGKIEWHRSSWEIYNLIRGLAHPYPGAFFYYKNKQYFVRKAQIGGENNKNFVGRIPGRVIRVGNSFIEVLCGKGSLMITEIEDKDSQVILKPSEIVKSITDTLQ